MDIEELRTSARNNLDEKVKHKRTIAENRKGYELLIAFLFACMLIH